MQKSLVGYDAKWRTEWMNFVRIVLDTGGQVHDYENSIEEVTLNERKQFVENLQKIKEVNELSFKMLDIRFGLYNGCFSNLIKFYSSPRENTLSKVATKLNVNIEDLLTRVLSDEECKL